ncbi:hypothetical protein [Oceanobacillus saliphilus]|uniref:hypothetical protein n=1 Tax=Oceanobacillus saliphilus TaxID=2925834 RepID=UPI00201E6F93|nr:hypothetical protein [Oceanobacillus saliphilus]
MPEYKDKDFVNALEEHTKALNRFVDSQSAYGQSVNVVRDYSALLRSIDNRLKDIESKLPNRPLGKY